MIHYLAWRRVPGAKVVAIASRDEKKRAGDWRTIRGNFGPPGQQMELQGVAAYGEFEELLADPRIDLIDVCLPAHLHHEVTLAALAAGKHVVCEKPIALKSKHAIAMRDAARNAGRQLLIAHIVPFFPEYDYARQLISSGKQGRLLGGHFKRIIDEPANVNEFYDLQRIGGPMVDLHIHDVHFIRLICGMPRAVFTSGRMRDNVPEFFTTQFLFDDPQLAVSATSGVIRQSGRSFTQGFEIHLERATVLFELAVMEDKPMLSAPLTVLTSDGRVWRPELATSDPIDAFAKELGEAVVAIESGQASAVLDAQLAIDSLTICHREAESLRDRRMVDVI
jgi:predicted dehydrogenase